MSEIIKVYEDDCYDVNISMEGDLPFFHVNVKKESLAKSDVISGREIFKEVKRGLKLQGFQRVYAASYTMNFAELLGPGYKTIEKFPEDGFELIVWETGE